jgi:putative membrane protein
MRIVSWTIRLLLFVLLVAFAAKNLEPVTLRFYFDIVLKAPLVVVLFGFFAAGALLGILAVTGTLLRQRREIARLRRTSEGQPEPPPLPPVPGV